MQLDLTDDQRAMTDMFARFLDAESSIARVRAAIPSGGFDPLLWKGLGEQGALSIRVAEEAGGLGLGIFDAGLLMEEAGRTLVSGPLAEAIVAARLLAELDPGDKTGLRDAIASGHSVVTIAMHDVAKQKLQLVAGGAVASHVIARDGDQIVLVEVAESSRDSRHTLASTPIGRLALDQGKRTELGSGKDSTDAYRAALEEWKLLMAFALNGLSKEAIRVASAYACERSAFGRPVGAYQAVSHPLADAIVEADVGVLLAWRAIREIADGAPRAGASVSLTAWWAAKTADKAVTQALHTFGGYGLTLEYDAHLFNLRAKAWPLILGDPDLLLEEAGRRLYHGEEARLPDAGPLAIDFDFGPEAEALAAETRAFFEKHLTPELRAKAHYSFEGHDPGFHKQIAGANLAYPAWPKRMGGREADPFAVEASLRVWEENGWTTHAQGTTNIVGFLMDKFGSAELKEQALKRVVAGEATCSLGFSEPGSGSDVFAAKTRATWEGDTWVINGSKMFTSGAESSDYVFLLARTDPDAPKHAGLTMYIVPLKAPGVTIQAVRTFQDERTNITFYDNVRVPDSWRLGEVGKGLMVMAASLSMEHGMSFFKGHSHMLHAAEDLCRKTTRGDKLMIEDPAVQKRLASSTANVAASELLHIRSLWSSTHKGPDRAFGPASKMYSSEVYRSDSFDLLNLTAPESLAFDSEEAAYINRCYRHSQVATVYGGTSEVHRSMIAEKRLGLPRTR